LDGGKIVVDGAVAARHGMLVVAIIKREHTIKRLHIGSDGIGLRPENPLSPATGRYASVSSRS
jgi:SOS-response transcriptional repressor LexA